LFTFNYNGRMKTWIYKGSRKPDTYLYVKAENDFSSVPKPVLDLMGALQFVLEVDLESRKKLARADIQDVRQRLGEQGFYIQMPPGDQEPERLC